LSQSLRDDRYFSPDPAQKEIAQQLYYRVAQLPLVCPHGHVDPRMFADPDYAFGSPVDLLIIPDHYVFRMLHSQGIPLEHLGVPRVDGGPVETDHRKIWQLFAESFYLFRGTPTGMWLKHELHDVFGVETPLDGETAQDIYDQIAERMARPDFRPRALFERFRIAVLCTTDAATDSLEAHRAIRASGWSGRVLPTFRPDAVLEIDAGNWLDNIQALEAASGVSISSYRTFIQALERQRAYFKMMGATATDHATMTAYTTRLSETEAENVFQRALHHQQSQEDAAHFLGHMLIQMARMSIDDGLVMQLHVGSLRDHDPQTYRRFGRNKGADIPLHSEFTGNLQPLLEQVGGDPRLTLILFTLDETTYARELAPLAGHYPALKLGPPWWFHDSLNGMRRYFDQVIETAGLYNTVGFNDDTRAFPSIPARHDLWRRAAADWIAGLVVRDVVDMEDAEAMISDCASGLAIRAYKFG
jgi:glucuronate isomerase